jgi:quaternary ammonium compound-resistance protein SugE
MAWIVLIVAGLLEVVWASLLPSVRGFTRLVPTVGFVGALCASMLLLASATRTIPVATGYAVWVGIGAVGTVLAGVVFKGESVNAAQFVSLAVLVLGIVAVKLTAAH